MNKLFDILSKQGDKVSLEININNHDYNIYFKAINGAGEVLLLKNEAIVSMLLLPLMNSDENDFFINGNVSDKFLSNISIIQDIYSLWDNNLNKIHLKNIKIDNEKKKCNRVGAFFTGGVDSFYTLLKNNQEITDLIFVHGYDIKLNDMVLREKVSKKINQVAKELGKNLIEIETNLRDLLDNNVPWGALGHGPALVAVGYLLSEYFNKIYIPSSYTYAELFKWGSHPLLDPYWSSDSLIFDHDGCEATRVDKVALIAKSDVALNSLRVCWKNPNSSYNCGKCEKCLRTMINLKVNNALDRCVTFENNLDYNLISKILVKDDGTRAFIKQNLAALKRTNGDEELEKALMKTLKPKIFHKLKKYFKLNY